MAAFLHQLLGLGQPSIATPSPALQKSSAQEKYVLVPPMFERSNRDRDRFLYSSYEYQFAKRQLWWLFNDYVPVGQYQGALLLSPPQDKHLTVEARIAPQTAAMSLRYQPKTNEQSTFLAVTVNPQSQEKATVGMSLFNPAVGVGAFATAPLAKRLSGTVAKVGVRYSSPYLSVGVVAEPARSSLADAWLVGQYQGLVCGAQVQLRGLSSPAALTDPDVLRSRSCVALAYEPSYLHTQGSGRFSAGVEMREGKNLNVSFYQHMALIRRHVNPLEERNVVGITNYVDVGIQINLDISDPAPPPPAKGTQRPPTPVSAPGEEISTINAAAAWQVNKNWLVKARAGDRSAGVAVAAKTWGQAGLCAAASVSVRYDQPFKPVYGATLVLENFGERRYERGASVLSGRAVLQRHEATDVDVSNAEGTGKVVIREALESEYNPPVADTTAEYL